MFIESFKIINLCPTPKASMLEKLFISWLMEHIGNCTNKIEKEEDSCKGGFHIHKLNV